MKKLAMMGILTLVVSMTLFGVVVGNNSESAYDGEEGLKSSADNQLKTMISGLAGK